MLAARAHAELHAPLDCGYAHGNLLSLASMILSGAFDRLPPNLRICFAHGGGSFAFPSRAAGKCVEKSCRRARHLTIYSEPLSGRFTVDSAVFDQRTLQFLVAIMGGDRVFSDPTIHYPLGEAARRDADSRKQFSSSSKKEAAGRKRRTISRNLNDVAPAERFCNSLTAPSDNAIVGCPVTGHF